MQGAWVVLVTFGALLTFYGAFILMRGELTFSLGKGQGRRVRGVDAVMLGAMHFLIGVFLATVGGLSRELRVTGTDLTILFYGALAFILLLNALVFSQGEGS